MNFRPLYDKVLVKRVEAEQKTKSGLYIPDTAKEKPLEGVVVALGTGKITEAGKELPLVVKINDKVLFGKFAGNEIKIDGEEFLLMREDEILGIME
jgi:chaperonin GroES